MTKIKLSEKIGKGYNQFWHFKGRYLLVKGSRGSKKSTTAAMKIIYLMMKYPLSNCLVVRQVFNTQRDSTWKQLQWAAETLGVSHLWKFTVSPLEATFQPTGQKIYFRGCDNPLSITSITAPVGFLNLCWIQEAYQLTSEQDFNKIDLSLRGQLPAGYFKQIIFTFNPWSDKSWIKKRFFDVPNDENKLALTTTYKCNEWLGPDDIKVFQDMKEKYPRRYKIEGLGEWGISEGLVFDNWKIQNYNIKELGDLPLWIGIDFGWQDPTAISIMRVDEQNKRLYFCDQFYKSQQTLEQVAAWVKARGYHKCLIYADSAEPRSIVELTQLGLLRVKPAKKGKGSIMQGIRKLQEYEIIIHPSCQNAQIEFSNYAFDKDKFDNWTDKPIDAFCHLIDAARYATQCGSDRKKLQTLSKGALGI